MDKEVRILIHNQKIFFDKLYSSQQNYSTNFTSTSACMFGSLTMNIASFDYFNNINNCSVFFQTFLRL